MVIIYIQTFSNVDCFVDFIDINYQKINNDEVFVFILINYIPITSTANSCNYYLVIITIIITIIPYNYLIIVIIKVVIIII